MSCPPTQKNFYSFPQRQWDPVVWALRCKDCARKEATEQQRSASRKLPLCRSWGRRAGDVAWGRESSSPYLRLRSGLCLCWTKIMSSLEVVQDSEPGPAWALLWLAQWHLSWPGPFLPNLPWDKLTSNMTTVEKSPSVTSRDSPKIIPNFFTLETKKQNKTKRQNLE